MAFGASATLLITATATRTTPVTNTATRTATTPADPNPANDSASTTVTGSTIPGLPNNGTPPLAELAAVLLALFLLGGLAIAGGRRVINARR